MIGIIANSVAELAMRLKEEWKTKPHLDRLR
jgi:hypothetical protein